jgi:superfamily II DNA or RNA helicase
LLDTEIDALANLGDDWESIVLENLLDTINRRLAHDEDRNKIILDCICASTERSILFFANSVDHAREMAVRLHLKGVAAAVVSGDTAPVARRYFLDRFQRGQIRVLCNHSVLTAGFDAPKTDMVLIARQVFSPVRYMQMVGRGLRGEKNGGTARCRIVTVLDNLGRFSDKHPYHFCARYFGDTSGLVTIA